MYIDLAFTFILGIIVGIAIAKAFDKCPNEGY